MTSLHSASQPKQSLRLRVVEVTRENPRHKILADEVSTSNDPAKSENKSIELYLEGIWMHGHIIKGTILHLLDPLYDRITNTYSIDNSTGLLVIEPDNLLTCTLVASTLFCERKTWLNNVFLGQIGTNRAMLVGTLVHETFQYGVKNKIVDINKLIKFSDELLDDATVMLEIYSVELHMKDVRDEVISYLSSVKEWIEKYMLSGPKFPLTNNSDLEVKVIGINDIEENVWSTKYGLKGKIDVTGSVRVFNRRNKSIVDKTLPLELKTGNPVLSASHAAQVSLYSMMIEDRYTETNQGLVIYLKGKAAMHDVPLTHNIKRDLVQRRNEINYHMKSYFFGPEMSNDSRVCRNCDRLTECLLISTIYEQDTDRFDTMMNLKKAAMGHLDDEFIEFFKKYHEKLVSILLKKDPTTGNKSGDQINNLSDSFWNYTSEKAEMRGTGFGKLELLTAKDDKTESSYVTFKRHKKHPGNLLLVTENNNSDSKPAAKKLKIDDYFKPKAHEKSEPKTKPFDVAVNLTRYRIAVSLDEPKSDMDSQNSSTALAIGFMHEIKEHQLVLKILDGAEKVLKPNLMYRLDKIEKKMNLDIERVVLVRLLAREDWRCDRIRSLLLDPFFEPSENIDMNLHILSSNFEEIKELDGDDQKCVVDAVSTDNYFVINEKRITKKSRLDKVVSVLTRVICSIGRTVLIVAPKVDELVDLMRLIQKRVRFILIDDGKSIKARFKYASNLVKVPSSENMSIDQKFETYIKQHEKTPVVITSYTMSAAGLLFTRRKFDYCVAYDCDKTELLISLSPMFCSDRHVILDVKEGDSKAQTRTEDVTLGEHLRVLRD